MKSSAFAIFACVLLSFEWADAFGFGGGCGGGCAPQLPQLPPPPPLCLPKLSLPCPPPPPQFPQLCLPKLSLPCPPPPPQFPQLCLPKLSLPCPPPPCGGCGRKKRDTEGEVAAPTGPVLCTSEKLRQILLENISASATESKVNIEKAVINKRHGNFVVSCDKLDFDHVIKSKDFCQETAHEVTCYIYRAL
uniref:Ground-like domain-containing protein n=1 Tax=Plectus sambesii TaxID=2011161 RepID=A0A914X9Y1_9BILA